MRVGHWKAGLELEIGIAELVGEREWMFQYFLEDWSY
jgi:hypothetical protein